MEVTFKFNVGSMVTIIDAKIEGRVVSASIDIDGAIGYSIMFWHEGSRRVEHVGEWELK